MKKVICKIHKETLNISTIEVEDKPLDLNFVRQHIGNSDGNGLFYCIYYAILELPEIVIIEDLAAEKKGLPLVLTHEDLEIHGDCVICVIGGASLEGLNLWGMTERQAEIIKSMLTVGVKVTRVS